MKRYEAFVTYATRDGSHRTLRMYVEASTKVKARRLAEARTVGDGRRRVREVRNIAVTLLGVI